MADDSILPVILLGGAAYIAWKYFQQQPSTASTPATSSPSSAWIDPETSFMPTASPTAAPAIAMPAGNPSYASPPAQPAPQPQPAYATPSSPNYATPAIQTAAPQPATTASFDGGNPFGNAYWSGGGPSYTTPSLPTPNTSFLNTRVSPAQAAAQMQQQAAIQAATNAMLPPEPLAPPAVGSQPLRSLWGNIIGPDPNIAAEQAAQLKYQQDMIAYQAALQAAGGQ